MRDRRHALLVLTCVSVTSLAAACATSRPAAVHARRDVVKVAPLQPLQLAPASARFVARVDLDALRPTPWLSAAERWVRSRTCFGPESLDWLLQRTSYLVLAAFEDARAPGGSAAVVISSGRYDAGDAEQALATASSAAGSPGAALSLTTHAGRRLHEASAASLASVQLDATTLALGQRAQVLALLDVVDGRAGAWVDTPQSQQLDAKAWLAAHSVAVVGSLSNRAQRRMQRGLAAIGGRRLGVGLERGAVALHVSGRHSTAHARLRYPDAATAGAAANQAMPVLHRANFLLRLMGAGLPLERTQVVAMGERVELSLSLEERELDSLLQRLEWVLDAGESRCGVRASAPATGRPG